MTSLAWRSALEQVAQLGVRLEGERVLALGAVQRDRGRRRRRRPDEVLRAGSRRAGGGCRRRAAGSMRGACRSCVFLGGLFVLQSGWTRRCPSCACSCCDRRRRRARRRARGSSARAPRAMRLERRRPLGVRRTMQARRSLGLASRTTAPSRSSSSVRPVTLPPVTISGATARFIFRPLAEAVELRHVVEARERDAEALAQPPPDLGLDLRRAREQAQPEAQRRMVAAAGTRLVAELLRVFEQGVRWIVVLHTPSARLACSSARQARALRRPAAARARGCARAASWPSGTASARRPRCSRCAPPRAASTPDWRGAAARPRTGRRGRRR